MVDRSFRNANQSWPASQRPPRLWKSAYRE